MPNERLRQIFDQNRIDIRTPDSRVNHDWFRTATALISKPLWQSEAAKLVKPQIAEYYSKYTNSREYKQWLNTEISKESPDDRTKSALAQLYGLTLVPTQGIIIHEGLLGSSSTVSLENAEDNSLSAFVQDWTISRVEDPLSFFKLVNKKLVSDGIYVITDRKPFENLTDKHFEPDGVARILEQREIVGADDHVEQFIIPKLFVKDLPGELWKAGFQVVYTTEDDKTCIYNIAIAVKSKNPIQQITLQEMIDTVWPHLLQAREALKKKFTEPVNA